MGTQGGRTSSEKGVFQAGHFVPDQHVGNVTKHQDNEE